MFRSVLHWIQKPDSALFILVGAITIALQVQITLGTTDTYAGLRIGLGDLFLPLVGLYVGISLLMKHSTWPQWSVPHMWAWLAALLSVMTLALFQGYFSNGFFSSWALINKYVGFYVLLAYCALGGWLASNADDPKQLFKYVMWVCCGFYTLTLLFSFLSIIWSMLGHNVPWIGLLPWDGLMANRNAFGVMAIMVMLFFEIDRRDAHRIPLPVYTLFLALLPSFALFNASRTIWIFGGAILLLSFIKQPLRQMAFKIFALTTGILITLGTIYIAPDQMRQANNSSDFFMGTITAPTSPVYQTDKKRIIAVEDGIELYSQSSWLFGGGLGSYESFQIEKRGEFIDIIDFSALWLLVETGPLGLIVFAGFFIACTWRLYLARQRAFHRALFFFMIAFAFMSCLHELTYTRFIWFFLGLGLVNAPLTGRK